MGDELGRVGAESVQMLLAPTDLLGEGVGELGELLRSHGVESRG